MSSDPLQFGFKKKTSTSHALFTLKSTIDYFNNRGSDVYVAFLDCTKAFDRISHYGLFNKLMDRRLPLCLLLLIIVWHLNLMVMVKWGDKCSKKFPVPLGTKQGGVMSPGFFSAYIDDMVKVLRDSGLECHISGRFLGSIFFADDLAIVAPTKAALQKMINLCSEYYKEYCLQFNSFKSKVLVFGILVILFHLMESLSILYLSGSTLVQRSYLEKNLDFQREMTYRHFFELPTQSSMC